MKEGDLNIYTMKTVEIGPTVLLASGAVFNFILIICLHRTWKYWNQLKWYVLTLTLANCIEVLFTLTYLLGSSIPQSWPGGDLSCKILMLMEPLGPSVANMALAASSVHVLLTAITGCQGNKLRHGLVLGLFVLLSLPLPVSKIPIFSVMTERSSHKELNICTDLEFFQGYPHYRFYYFVAGSIALVFFPLVVIVGAVGGAAMILCLGSSREHGQKGHVRGDSTDTDNMESQEFTGNVKTESNSAEVTLVAILGVVLMVLCVPLHVFIIFFRYKFSHDTVTVYMSLVYVFYSKVSVIAIVCAVFACAHVYRKGRQQQQTQEPRRGAGERTKLVH
ncbi:hypothetical protein ACOMHN_030404 [Nucella lapillus]